MKAGIYFTGSGPIVILTSYGALDEPELAGKLASKGIKKFIAYELPVDTVREKYGAHYDMVMNDLKQDDDLRVMDYNGHHIMNVFSMRELDRPIYYE